MGILLCPRPQGECVLALPVDRNTAEMLPLFANDLQANAVVSTRGYVLTTLLSTSASHHGNRAHLTHGLPVIKPPIDGLAISDLLGGGFIDIVASVRVRPNEQGVACPVPDAVWRVASTRLLQYAVAFCAQHLGCSESKFDESHGDIDVEALVRIHGHLHATRR